MKRSPALVALSHDHHQALFVALHLRRAADPPVDRQRFLDFFDSEGAEHFRVEEEVLLPYVANDFPEDDPQLARVVDEHEQLRQRARALQANPHPSAGELQNVGVLLAEHVRFEERQLFPRIEVLLDVNRLTELERQLKQAESGPPKMETGEEQGGPA